MRSRAKYGELRTAFMEGGGSFNLPYFAAIASKGMTLPRSPRLAIISSTTLRGTRGRV